MPDRDLPEHVRQQLSSALDRGAPLLAPLPSEARFATLRGAMPSPRWGLRAVTVAVAAAGIVVVALAGPPQPREWVVQSVNEISRQVGLPAGSATPSPRRDSTPSGQTKPSAPESPVTNDGTNEPGESPQPAGSPEPRESPDGDDTPQSGPAQPQSSPTPRPSDGGGGGDHSPGD